MQMRTFLILLDCELKKDYPGLELGFYLSRRSRYVHMGSNIPLNRLDNFQSIINKIQQLWFERKTDDKFDFCEPYLIVSTRWKYDYIIFRKNYYNEVLQVENIKL